MTSIAAHSIGALSIGALIRLSDFEGVVVGVYDRTCNIRLDDGSLVTCTSANHFNMPRGIRLGTPENFQFKAYMPGGTAAHFRAAFEPIAGSIYNIDAAGIHTHDFSQLPSSKRTRNVFPVEIKPTGD